MAASSNKENKIEQPLSSDSDSEDESPCLYTFAVTGETPAFQAIFVCLDCSQDDETLCLCHACAEICHAGHEIDYIAMGPSYCDCQKMKSNACRLKEASEQQAKEISVSSKGIEHVAPPGREEESYIQEAFTISSLNDKSCDRLVREATELVKHSRDTHWLELNSTLPNNGKYSKLEQLALTILGRHVKEYQLCNNSNTREFHGGAEWWVQVKPISRPSNEERLDHDGTESNEAVDLHFDKDEVLAENFDLGSFPTLSTVTYLTDTLNASPTVVFPHTYDKDEGEVMNEMLVSFPRRGKHLVFDGRLLHGAPAHHALRSVSDDDEMDSSVNRVTFLVNVWVDRQPSGVKPLSHKIRQLVRTAGKKRKLPTILQQPKPDTVEFERALMQIVNLEKEEDLPESIRGRIEFPFVSKGATWISRVRGNSLVVVTFPPPPTKEDTLRIKFGPGLQAYLEYQYVSNGRAEERLNVAGTQVDYV